MTQKHKIQLFEEKRVRTVWDDELQEWFFSVVDVVDVLTDSKDPTDYLKKMRKRDPQLKAYMGTNCPQIIMLTKTGKSRKTLAANTEQLFRETQGRVKRSETQGLVPVSKIEANTDCTD